jgi:hypothetical protein
VHTSLTRSRLGGGLDLGEKLSEPRVAPTAAPVGLSIPGIDVDAEVELVGVVAATKL